MTEKIADLLLPGSVWEHFKSKKQATVLMLSNTSIKNPEVAEKFPPQVIFLTHDYQILNQTIDLFMRSRSYVTMDSVVEALSYSLTAEPSAENEEGDIDLDSVLLPEDATTEEETTPETTEVKEAFIQGAEAKTLQLNVGPHPWAQQLRDAFVSYSEAPHWSGDTQHVLKFELGSTGLSLEALRLAFGVEDPNSIQRFIVDSVYESTAVEIDGYVETFLQVGGDKAYGVVYVTSAGDFRSAEAVAEAVAELQKLIQAEEDATEPVGDEDAVEEIHAETIPEEEVAAETVEVAEPLNEVVAEPEAVIEADGVAEVTTLPGNPTVAVVPFTLNVG